MWPIPRPSRGPLPATTPSWRQSKKDGDRSLPSLSRPDRLIWRASFVIVTPGSIQSGSKTTIVLQARDEAGNDETMGGLTVTFVLGKAGGGRGAFGPVTDNHNGTYTVTFTGTIAGSNTIVATMDGLRVTSIAPAITVTPGPVSLAKSIVTVSPASMKVGGIITVTLQAKDAAGNKLTAGGLTVTFILGNSKGGQGTFSSVTDNENGENC